MTFFNRFAFTICLALASFAASAQDRVVYHFDSGIAQATKCLRNIRNHLDTEPKTQATAVAHAEGVVRIANLQAREHFAYIKP